MHVYALPVAVLLRVPHDRTPTQLPHPAHFWATGVGSPVKLSVLGGAHFWATRVEGRESFFLPRSFLSIVARYCSPLFSRGYGKKCVACRFVALAVLFVDSYIAVLFQSLDGAIDGAAPARGALG